MWPTVKRLSKKCLHLLYKGLLIWLDDLLGYEIDEQKLLIWKSAYTVQNETFDVEPEQMKLFPEGSKMVRPHFQCKGYES